MKKLFTTVWLMSLCFAVGAQNQEIPEPTLDPESCTSIMVGKKAVPASPNVHINI